MNPDHLWLGTNKDNIRDAVKKGRIAYGERHGNSKLTEKDVLEIRADYEYHGKNNARVLGNLYGVSRRHINDIVNGKIWKHV